MIDAVLFDLDGTLLINDMGQFMPCYLRSLAGSLADLVPSKDFVSWLLRATEQMAANRDPATTNEQAFRLAFNALSSRPLEELDATILAFYANEFGRLVQCTTRRPEARPVVEAVRAAGRRVAVATHPLFPAIAIQQRLDWAGVADVPFDLITTYEIMHSSKPHLEYYREIANKLGILPERCLMVGDDLEMDRPAEQVGMRFYWITEELPENEQQGSLSNLHALVEDGFLDR